MNDSGAAGFDGWTAKELKAMLKYGAFLVDELYTLWVGTAEKLHTTLLKSPPN